MKKEGATWQEERHARLVLAAFQKPVHVWSTVFRELVAKYQKGPTPRDTRLMPTPELPRDSDSLP